MRQSIDPRDKIADGDAPIEQGYDAWKRAKVQRGLTEAQDRARMIPLDDILRDFRLER